MRFKDVQCRKTWVINVHYGLQHSVQLLTHKHLPFTSIWHNREQWELFNLNYKMSDRIYAPATFLTSSHKTLKQIMCNMHQLTNDSYTLGRQGTNSKIPLLLEETATLTQHENVTLWKKCCTFIMWFTMHEEKTHTCIPHNAVGGIQSFVRVLNCISC